MLLAGFVQAGCSLAGCLCGTHAHVPCASLVLACKICWMRCPRAICCGVCPLWLLVCASAPLASKKATISACLHFTARCNGVSPYLSRASIFAPHLSNAWATNTLPRRAAICSAEQPFTLSHASTLAPACTRVATTAALAVPSYGWALLTQYRGVCPYLSLALGSAP